MPEPNNQSLTSQPKSPDTDASPQTAPKRSERPRSESNKGEQKLDASRDTRPTANRPSNDGIDHAAQSAGWLLLTVILVSTIGVRALYRVAETANPDSATAFTTAPVLVLDINVATAAQLRALPSIGPKLAEAIIRHRESHGDFASVEALEEVHGFGPKTLEQLRAMLRVGPSDRRYATQSTAGVPQSLGSEP